MKRRWERDRTLAHIPLGWRRTAATMLALAAEHCLAAGVAVRWCEVAHPYCPALVLVEQGFEQGVLPLHRERTQFAGRAVIDRVALRALTVCMACGSTATPPTHMSLHASGSDYIALLCDECQDVATLDGSDFWCVIGRFDPLILERDQDHDPLPDLDGESEETWDGDDDASRWDIDT